MQSRIATDDKNFCCGQNSNRIESTWLQFWKNKLVWIKASKNTLNCLLGCSIGDFGMIFYLQAYHPNIGLMLTMILAMSAGLFTSIILEMIILKIREGFVWKQAIRTAISMSFISMLAMEFTANMVDFYLTNGNNDPRLLWTWVAISISMLAGFLVPLPYNYYKIQVYGKSCH